MSESNECSKRLFQLKERKRNVRTRNGTTKLLEWWSGRNLTPYRSNPPCPGERPSPVHSSCSILSTPVLDPQKNWLQWMPAVTAVVEAEKSRRQECHPPSAYWPKAQNTSPGTDGSELSFFCKLHRNMSEIFSTVKENINSECSTIRCEQSVQTFHLGPVPTSSQIWALVQTAKMKDRNEK